VPRGLRPYLKEQLYIEHLSEVECMAKVSLIFNRYRPETRLAGICNRVANLGEAVRACRMLS
jgi:hypothetical protein